MKAITLLWILVENTNTSTISAKKQINYYCDLPGESREQLVTWTAKQFTLNFISWKTVILLNCKCTFLMKSQPFIPLVLIVSELLAKVLRATKKIIELKANPEQKMVANLVLWSPFAHARYSSQMIGRFLYWSNWDDHSRPHRPCSFWSAPRITTSGKVQHWKSAIHRLFVTLHMLSLVKSDKSDWLRIGINYSAHAKENGPSQRFWPRGLDSGCWPKEAQPVGKRMCGGSQKPGKWQDQRKLPAPLIPSIKEQGNREFSCLFVIQKSVYFTTASQTQYDQ